MQWLKLALLASFLLTSQVRAELNCKIYLEDTKDLQAQPVFTSLKEALEKVKKKEPVEYIEFDGIKIPKYSKTSKWRAVAVMPDEDLISHKGYESGFYRNGDNVPDNRKAKYNEVDGELEYEFADGRKVKVTPKEARALEFSYIDKKNPKSALNSIVVGVHEDPEKILKVIKQSGASKLLDESAYIRLDEIEVENLNYLSAEELYKKFNLHNPSYSPKGEFVVDQSIPPENLISSFKFKSVAKLDVEERFVIDEVVAYEALSGATYIGRVETKTVRDGYLTIYYVDEFGRKHMDIAHVSNIKKQSEIMEGNFTSQIVARDLDEALAQEDFDGVMQMLKNEVELKALYSGGSNIKLNSSVGEHAINILKDFQKAFRHYHQSMGLRMGPQEMKLLNFFSKVILVHEIGVPLSMALKGTAKHYDYTAPIAKRFFEQLGMSDKEIVDGLAIIKRGDFEERFSIEKLLQQLRLN